ncbi:MAG: hypothetical protein ACRD0G_16985 [Acidimicrobiales bacterium]
MGGGTATHACFGLRWRAHFALPELPVVGGGAVDLDVSLAPRQTLAAAFSGSIAPPSVDHGTSGARAYVTERGRRGDYRIDFDDRVRCHLSADRRQLRIAVDDVDDPAWRRFLLDTVLATASLASGFEALHGGAYERDGAAVAVVAGQGGGKSTMLAELIGRGRLLFTDDILTLSVGTSPASIVAHPGPPLMNLTAETAHAIVACDAGRVIAAVDGECWVGISRAATTPLPLAAVVMLERGASTRVTVDRIGHPLELLRNSLISGRGADRLARRFALFSDVAESVPIRRLRAPIDASAPALADALEAAVDDIPAAIRA